MDFRRRSLPEDYGGESPLLQIMNGPGPLNPKPKTLNPKPLMGFLGFGSWPSCFWLEVSGYRA